MDNVPIEEMLETARLQGFHEALKWVRKNKVAEVGDVYKPVISLNGNTNPFSIMVSVKQVLEREGMGNVVPDFIKDAKNKEYEEIIKVVEDYCIICKK